MFIVGKESCIDVENTCVSCGETYTDDSHVCDRRPFYAKVVRPIKSVVELRIARQGDEISGRKHKGIILKTVKANYAPQWMTRFVNTVNTGHNVVTKLEAELLASIERGKRK